MGELNFRVAPKKNYWGIKMKCGIIDYVGRDHMQKLVAVGLLVASPRMGDMYQYGVLPITFLRNPFD